MNEQKISRQLTFEKLWLISEKELSAREVTLSPGKNLLTGGNGTGKSRVTKHCFWALGCEVHKRVWGGWDAGTAAALFFTFEAKSYTAVRRLDRFALLAGDGKVIVATGQYKTFQEVLCSILHYDLTLMRPNSTKFSLAGFPYLAVPFYLDQDGSWGTNWNTFDNLAQFTKWPTPVFELFIGLSPNAYLVAKARRQELTAQVDEIRKELELQRRAFEKVGEALSDDAPSLDPLRFKSELRTLAATAGRVQQEQRELRTRLTALATMVARAESDLALTRNAQLAVVGDLTYLTALPAKTALTCPTCGWEHLQSFHAKLGLGTEADALGELVGELTAKLQAARERHAVMLGRLAKVETQLSSLDTDEVSSEGRVGLRSLIASYSKKTVSTALTKIENETSERLVPLERDQAVQAALVKQFEDRDRRLEVKKTFVSNVNRFMADLKTPPEERVLVGSLGRRPSTGGSEMPRSILAVHLAMLHTGYAYSDVPMLPLVVDTFQQSGQDESNLPAMINEAYKSALPGQQTIFAAETVPKLVDLDDVTVQTFTEERHFLRRSEYQAIAAAFAPWIAEMDAAAERELVERGRR